MSNRIKPAQQLQNFEESSHQIRIPVQKPQEEPRKTTFKDKQLSSKKQIKFNVEIQVRESEVENQKKCDFNVQVAEQMKKISPQQKLCKICLEEGILMRQVTNEQSPKKVLIRPCLCSGSIGFVHDECMKQWIWKQVNKNRQKKLDCQICHKRINYEMRSKMQFICSLDNFLQNLRAFHISSLLFLAMTLITVIVILHLPQQTISINEALRTIMIILIALLALAIIVVCTLIARQCFFIKIRTIEHVYSYDEWQEILSRSHRTIRGSSRTIRSQSNSQSRRTINGLGIRNREEIDRNPSQRSNQRNPSIENIPQQNH